MENEDKKLEPMDLQEKLTLALLWLQRFKRHGVPENAPWIAYKTADFSILDSLNERDLIFDAVKHRKATTPIGFTEQGEALGKELLDEIKKLWGEKPCS